jgi:biotin operon repressor
MKISESAVSKHIEILKEKGYIERVGGTRGYWKINKEKNRNNEIAINSKFTQANTNR